MTQEPRTDRFPNTITLGVGAGNVDVRQEYDDLQMMGFTQHQALRVLVEDAQRLGWRVRAGNAEALARFNQTALLLTQSLRTQAQGVKNFSSAADSIFCNALNQLYDLCKGTHLECAMAHELVRINKPNLYGTKGAWKISFAPEYADVFTAQHELYLDAARQTLTGGGTHSINIDDFLDAANGTAYAGRLRDNALEYLGNAIRKADPAAIHRAWSALQNCTDPALIEPAITQLAAFIEQAHYTLPAPTAKRSSRNLGYQMAWHALLSPCFSSREQHKTDPRLRHAAQSFVDRNGDKMDSRFTDGVKLSPVFGLWSLPTDKLGPAIEKALDSFDALKPGKDAGMERAAIARRILSIVTHAEHGAAHPRLTNLTRFLMQDTETQTVSGDTLELLLRFYAGSPHYNIIYDLAVTHLQEDKDDFMHRHFAEELAGCLFETAIGGPHEADAYEHLRNAVIQSQSHRQERKLNDTDAEIELLSRYLNINEYFNRRRHADQRPEPLLDFVRGRLKQVRDNMAPLAPVSAARANSILIADAIDTPRQHNVIDGAQRFIQSLPRCIPGRPVSASPLAREINIARAETCVQAMRACQDNTAAQLFFNSFIDEHKHAFAHTNFDHKRDVMDTENPAQIMIASAFFNLPGSFHGRLTMMAEQHVMAYLQAGQRLSATKLMDTLYTSVRPNPTRPWIVHDDDGDARAVSIGRFHDGRNKTKPAYGPITVLPRENLTSVVNDHTPVMLRWMFLRGQTRQAPKGAASMPVYKMAAAFVAAACHNPPDTAHWNAYVAEARRSGSFAIKMAD